MVTTKPACCTPIPSNIPNQLIEIQGWLNWLYEQDSKNPDRWNKVPYYLSGGRRYGTQGTPEDLSKLGSFDKALLQLESNPVNDGVGLAMLPQWELVALDIDDCVQCGQIDDEILSLIEGAYAEISPSGTGIRAFWKGTAKKTVNGNWELYPHCNDPLKSFSGHNSERKMTSSVGPRKGRPH